MPRKSKPKARMLIPILIGVCIIVIACCIAFFVYTFSGNYITYSNIDEKAETAAESTAKDSNVIVYNGIVLGASKNGSWINAKGYYEANGAKNDVEVNLYSKEKYYGTFKLATLRKHREGLIYTTIGKDTPPEYYLAVSSNVNMDTNFAKKVDATKEDEKMVKKAIGSYNLLNRGVNITEVYTVNIEGANDKIICATAKKKSIFGVYSAVVYVTNNEPYLVKYAYVRDTDEAERWPVYSLKYIKDLNGDSKPELILEEVTGQVVRYTVQELRKNHEFYQVLKVSVDI